MRVAATSADQYRHTTQRFAWWSLAVALVLHLHACAALDEAKPPAAPASPGVSAEWYDVVSFQPGPEVTDASMRQRIEASGQPWKVRDKATGIELVLVLPGEFLMGSPISEPGRQTDEGPQHPVHVTDPFYLGATEVTQGQRMWRYRQWRYRQRHPAATKHERVSETATIPNSWRRRAGDLIANDGITTTAKPP